MLARRHYSPSEAIRCYRGPRLSSKAGGHEAFLKDRLCDGSKHHEPTLSPSAQHELCHDLGCKQLFSRHLLFSSANYMPAFSCRAEPPNNHTTFFEGIHAPKSGQEVQGGVGSANIRLPRVTCSRNACLDHLGE